MKFLRDLKLQYKVLFMSVIPVLVMCIVAIIINNTVVKNKLLEDTKQMLRATAESVEAAYAQNTGDYFVNSAGDVWKGSYNISLSEVFLDNIEKNTDIALTFFYGDQRLVTTLKDKNGERITGSKAGDFLVETVLRDGNDVFTNRVLVEDEFYFGYYIPVYQNNSDTVVGMIFAGMPVSRVYESLNLITYVFVITIAVILISTIVVCTIMARSIAKSIHESMEVVQQVSDGNLCVSIAGKSLQRKDEAGALTASTKKLVDSLSRMIGLVSDNTMTLNASSEEMNAVAGQASEAVENINRNLQNVLSGAEQQTENVMHIRGSIDNINMHIENTLAEADDLSDASKQMLEAGSNVEQTLLQLDAANKDVLEEIENIREQTMNTNASVEKIMNAVTLISDIASQTNLLSLNASIEAARAGEAGRGFAVVAEEISQLATQSNEASREISNTVKLLSDNSNRTVAIMNDVQTAINEQTQNVTETSRIFGLVQNHISRVADGIDTIRESTTKLGSESDEIAQDIKVLSDISKSNEGSIKETLKYSDNVRITVNSVADMSGEVSTSANDMAGALAQFQR